MHGLCNNSYICREIEKLRKTEFNMKNSVLFAALLLVFSACNDNEKNAKAMLSEAETLYSNGAYAEAKTTIDSIKSLYPKEFNVLREGLALSRRVEIKEQERNIQYCDSLIPIKQQEAVDLAKNFTFEKELGYEDIGNYIYKQQTVERNVERCYIRSGVNENGEMYIGSVYYGKLPIKHVSIKLSTKDGFFVESPQIAYDGGNNFRFDDAGMKSEIVTYKGEKALEMAQFITDHLKDRIKVEYEGEKPYVIYLSDLDKKAIAATMQLSIVLTDINTLMKEKEKAMKKIEYLNFKLAGKDANQAAAPIADTTNTESEATAPVVE